DETAIKAMHAGVFDYLLKPFIPELAKVRIQRALRHQQLLREKHRYENDLAELDSQRTAEVERLAYYDSLTNLPNRALFDDRLNQALAIAQRDERLLATMFVSLDQFKVVNDFLGHAAGDKLLTEVAARLQRCVQEGETIARFAGDEFVLLLTQ